MTYNEYRNDLMDNYGAIDRTWKLNENKLIILDGEGNELYFYDLYHSEKDGFFGVLEEIRRFNLVNDKNVVKLNLYQRYKLMSLIALKKDYITELNRVKKQMSDYEKLIKKGVHKTMEGGKTIAKAIRRQGPNPVGIIQDVLDTKRIRDKAKVVSEKPEIKPAPTKPSPKYDYESLKARYQLQLRMELERDKTANDLDRQYLETQKSKFQKRIEELAKKRLEDSISREDIMTRKSTQKGER